jgi:hypothetical protein
MDLVKAFITAILVATLSGCDANPVVVNAVTQKSPDGIHSVSISYEQYSGPGNAADFARVNLRYAKNRSGNDILNVDLQDIKVDHIAAKWLNNTTLSLTVRKGDILFQAVKCAGVAIITKQV